MSKGLLRIACSLLVGLALVNSSPLQAETKESEKTIHCYVGGTMRPAMEKLVEAYKAKTGVKVELDHGDSGSNMIKAEMSGAGDLYVAHDPFHDMMMAKGLAVKGWLAAYLEPVIVVQKGNPKKITGLRSFKNEGMRIVLTDRIYSTMGYLVSAMLRKAGIEDEVEKNVLSRPRAGGEAANAVILGHADAAVVWNAVAFLRKKDLDTVEIEEDLKLKSGIDSLTGATYTVAKGDQTKSHVLPIVDLGKTKVTIDLLKSSKCPELAEDFAKFAVSKEAEAYWKELSYIIPSEKEKKSFEMMNPKNKITGKITVYSAAAMQSAVDVFAEKFKEKHGVEVQVDYGGSGMALTRLKLAQSGDIFIPGDSYYIQLAEKESLIKDKTNLCYFIPVILVQKGNPKNIKDITDMARPGIRLGLGNAKSCQIGRTAEQMIEKNNIDKSAVEKNLFFLGTTVNELGIQMQTGHLDMALVWDITAKFYQRDTEIIPIPPEKNIISNVEGAILSFSKNQEAAKAFLDFMASEEGQEILKKHNFTVQLNQ